MTHAHHYVIETPNGALSHGRCRECGAERDFYNWTPEKGKKWGGGSAKGIREVWYTTKGDFVR